MSNRLVTQSMTSHDLVKRASRRLYRKRDGIGQTPCSYERYLVLICSFFTCVSKFPYVLLVHAASCALSKYNKNELLYVLELYIECIICIGLL